MPKIKTNKTASKRFHITGSGKIMRTRGGKSHLRRNKRPSVKRAYADLLPASGSDTKRIRRLLPHGV